MADNYIWNRFVEICSWHFVKSLSKSDGIEFVKYFGLIFGHMIQLWNSYLLLNLLYVCLEKVHRELNPSSSAQGKQIGPDRGRGRGTNEEENKETAVTHSSQLLISE